MSNYFASLFGGQNTDLNSDINQSGAISGFATGVGEGDVTAASKFYQDILSGDPTQEATALAPEISSLKKRAEENKKTSAEFGTRSGGTAAANAASDANVNADIFNLTGGLKRDAASGAASLGTSEQGLGLNANEVNAQESQQRMKNWQDSILSQGISGAINYGESFLPIAGHK